MFENMSEKEARESILRQAAAYCVKYDVKQSWQNGE